MPKLEQHSYLLALLALFIAAILCRPLLPIDETRYMTVAWEMFHTKNFFLLSMNYAPYHHKPPMLFWLINACWQIFGVSRWSALIPIFLASAATLILTGKLAAKLYPDDGKIREFTSWALLGSAPFLIYDSIVMFDLMLTAVNLAFFMTALKYSEKPDQTKTLQLGLLLGTGVLIKGPVVYLYTLIPLLFYPYWRSTDHTATPAQLYKALLVAVLISALPVSLWLLPALLQADNNFAYWLIWEQTAGRVKGDFSASHVRPFYFYVLLVPVMFLPWALFPSFWRNISRFCPSESSGKFLIYASLPVMLCFSLIAGKQPHYLLPLMPFVAIGLSRILGSDLRLETIRITVLGLVSVLIVAQYIGSLTFFSKYDLAPIATIYSNNRDKDFAFVGKYQGEIGFLARAEKPLDSLEHDEIKAWFKNHPGGLAIIRHRADETFPELEGVFSIPYRSRKLTVFKLIPEDRINHES
ncbi:MAG: glycosyltransferase family 39 protein [Alphaproteobacteria bacterium]|nr:glycosyltransferase family 39 protein [Alphaproteobacteria bacterium]MBP7759956.1 glycosyltransferase family 39 protein [Alphaproteobacteria bacterium]MBP7763310.1 glycosyltransferase family 39 protein [Alphaproteobacteria bacterium]MBP7905366.1 glycosyltransferase family 39 protein [Alphaproteobacteria bacterium]